MSRTRAMLSKLPRALMKKVNKKLTPIRKYRTLTKVMRPKYQVLLARALVILAKWELRLASSKPLRALPHRL